MLRSFKCDHVAQKRACVDYSNLLWRVHWDLGFIKSKVMEYACLYYSLFARR